MKRDPVLHLVAGPNGAGKTTLYERVIGPTTQLQWVNADEIAAAQWADDPLGRAYDAAVVAAQQRDAHIKRRRSFATETVFSHPSKLDLVQVAIEAGYLVTLHVVIVPEALAVRRVANRVAVGGHAVPEEKVRARFRRLWPLLASAIGLADTGLVYDNSRAATPFRVVARFQSGRLTGEPAWPPWTPEPLREAGSAS